MTDLVRPEAKFLLYQTEDGSTRVEVRFDGEAGQIDLIASDALLFEAERNPHVVRKRYVFDVMATTGDFVRTDPQLEERARLLVLAGLKPLDALHLASAEAGRADFFCTCDDRLLKRARVVAAPPTKAVSPLSSLRR